MKATLYELVDKIHDKWKALESQLTGVEVKSTGCPLTIERVGDRMRICWNGKPVTDCKTNTKIEAVFFLEQLKEKIDEQDEALIGRAKSALEILEKWVKK